MKTTPIFNKHTSEGLNSLPTVTRFTEYLTKTGWVKIKQNDRKILVFGTTEPSCDGSESPILVFPANDSYSDAKLRINDAVHAVATFRGKSFQDTLTEVFCYGVDILRQRIGLQAVRGIPLVQMPNLMRHYRDLIRKSVQLEMSPQGDRPYRLGKPSEAIKKSDGIVKKCLFGHTFAGSFGISIEMPLEIDENQFANVVHHKATLERLTMRRIAVGLTDAKMARQSGQIDAITENLEHGFNADICETMSALLTTLSEIDDSSFVEYTFDWSPLIVLDKELAAVKPVSFIPLDVAPIFQDAAKEMKKLHQKHQVTIRGEILALTDDPEKKDTDEKWRRTITLRCKNKPGVNIVRITLSSEADYTTACMARGHGQWLSVRGVLTDDGKDHRLRSPQKLKEEAPLFDDEA